MQLGNEIFSPSNDGRNEAGRVLERVPSFSACCKEKEIKNWLAMPSGLQILHPRFESGCRLQFTKPCVIMSSGNPEKLEDLLGKPREAFFVLAAHPFHTITMEPKHPALRAVSVRNLQGKVRKKRMGNKLVYVSGAPFWFTPEGQFEAAEQRNGLFVERVMLRTERGLREICNGKMI